MYLLSLNTLALLIGVANADMVLADEPEAARDASAAATAEDEQSEDEDPEVAVGDEGGEGEEADPDVAAEDAAPSCLEEASQVSEAPPQRVRDWWERRRRARQERRLQAEGQAPELGGPEAEPAETSIPEGDDLTPSDTTDTEQVAWPTEAEGLAGAADHAEPVEPPEVATQSPAQPAGEEEPAVSADVSPSMHHPPPAATPPPQPLPVPAAAEDVREDTAADSDDHSIAVGDWLSQITADYYGERFIVLWPYLCAHNKARGLIEDCHWIEPGQRVELPSFDDLVCTYLADLGQSCTPRPEHQAIMTALSPLERACVTSIGQANPSVASDVPYQVVLMKALAGETSPTEDQAAFLESCADVDAEKMPFLPAPKNFAVLDQEGRVTYFEFMGGE